MRRFKKIAVSAVAAFALVFGQATAPASAVDAPALNLVLDAGKLTTSSIVGFGANQPLSLTLEVPSGAMSIDMTNVTATLISPDTTGTSFLLQGTATELQTAFDAITFAAGCGGAVTVNGTLDSGGGLKNVFNGHYYKLVKTRVSFNDAITLATQTTFDGTPSGTPGYLATITSTEENQFLFRVMGGAGNNAWIAASDSATEGDWKWMTGPEAGTSFFSGTAANGGPVSGEFNGWASGEPNQMGDEDFAEVYGDGRWNDIPSTGGPQNFYLIEWGGMPGDDLSGAITVTDTATTPGQIPFTGEGTEASPYLVSSAADLAFVGGCAGATTYFKQTADIDLAGTNLNPFGKSDNYFKGNYDGGNFKIEGITVDDGSESLFGYVGSSNGPERTVIKNLDLSGTINVTDDSYSSLLTTEAYDTDFLNIDVDFAVVTEEYARYIGSLAGYAEDSTFTDIDVTGTMQLTDTTRVGGLIGQGDEVTFTNVTSDVDFTGVDGGRIGGIAGRLYTDSVLTGAVFTGSINVSSVYEVGGLVGYMDTGSVTKSYSTANITSVDGEDAIGGLIGETYEVELVEVFASGNIVSETANEVGGLIGRSEYTSVTDSYATGDVTAAGSVGALIGFSYELLALRVHAIGAVTATGSDVGMFGFDDGANNVEDSFWSPDFLGLLEANVNPFGNESVVTLAQATDIATYQAKNWVIGADRVVAPNVWTICADFNEGTPFLSFAFPNACLQAQVLKPVPTITGSGAALSELTAVPGTWDDGTALTYTWYADGVEIAGATSATYTPTLAQIGARITVKVTSTKEGFVAESATSSPVGPISAAAMTLKPVPTISGPGTVGQALTANAGTWDADVVLTYKWFVNGVEIAGATATSYTPLASQVGATISVQVTGTKAGYVSESKTSTSNKKVKAVVVVPVFKTTTTSFGGMLGNAWWMTEAMRSGVRKAVKASSKATTLVCTGIVMPGGSKSWLKTLGLRRAQAGCSIAKAQNPKLKVSYKFVVSKPKDKVQRGFSLTFSK